MKRFILIGLVVPILVSGCPQAQDALSRLTVKAVIGVSSTQGDAPFMLAATASDSTSLNGGPLEYAWDFGDGETASDETTSHTYTKPGRYVLKLTVTDPTGEVGVTAVAILVGGGEVVAIISADALSGTKPLTVQFDATASKVTDDSIRDYFWDFGDGETSQDAAPRHTYYHDGEYTVTLRIVTAGGEEAQTFTTITVGDRNASLQFDGGSYAVLPLSISQDFTTCTLEAWFKADTKGGLVVSVGDAELGVHMLPSDDMIRMYCQGRSANANSTALIGIWRHVAIVFDCTSDDDQDTEPADSVQTGAGRCVLYLNGAPLVSLEATESVTVDRITVGNGFSGKVGEVRFWSTARTNAELNANADRRVSGVQSGLLGAWPLDEGSGQTLRNAGGGSAGTLGPTTSVEETDPAWSTEGPPL